MKKSIGNVFFIIVCVVLFTCVLGQFGILPFRLTYFLTGSMMPAYAPGDLAVIFTKPQSLKVGDVVLFHENDAPIIHRISTIENGQITTKGDANNSDDTGTITDVDGKLLFSIPKAGYLIDYFHMLIQSTRKFMESIF